MATRDGETCSYCGYPLNVDGTCSFLVPPTPDPPDQERGLYGKYRVERVSDPTGRHVDCRYFVLDPQHDSHAATALRVYADSVQNEYPALAADLLAWLGVKD